MTKPIPETDARYQSKVRRRTEKHAAELAVAREFAQAHSLPALSGTLLQILWAERVRHQALSMHQEWIGAARSQADAATAAFWLKGFWVPGWVESQFAGV